MTTKNMDARREAFEAWLESAGFDVERFHYINGYRGNEQMAAWEAWNAALESICVELPDTVANTGTLTSNAVLGYKREVQEALTAAGVPYK